MRTRNDPPVLILGGISIDVSRSKSLAWDFLQLKKQFNPSLEKPGVRLSDLIAFEIKGSDLRSDMRSDSRKRRRRAFGLIDKCFSLLEKHGATVLADVHVKGQRPLQRWVYSQSISWLAKTFDAELSAADTSGLMILDSRTKVKNVPSVNGVTTQRYRANSEAPDRLVESPVFGHSDAHILLQVADILVSAVLFPCACAAYCLCLLDNVHPSDRYGDVRDRYGERLMRLETYRKVEGRRMGSIRVEDAMNRQPTVAMFRRTEFRLQ